MSDSAEFDSRRAAVDHDADADAVGLAEGVDPEQVAEAARHGGRG
jgi:hypothetical protein